MRLTCCPASLLLVLLLTTGCSTAPGVDAGPVADASCAARAASKPARPEIVGVFPMLGNLHVTWEPKDSCLDAVELWRAAQGQDYTRAYTLGGNVDNIHDRGAVGPGRFCYRVFSVRGALRSDPSPDACGAP